MTRAGKTRQRRVPDNLLEVQGSQNCHGVKAMEAKRNRRCQIAIANKAGIPTKALGLRESF